MADTLAPVQRVKPITKHDTTNIEFGAPDAIYIGGAGVVALVFNNNEVQNMTCIAGQTLCIAGVKRINATNTTATVMNALYYT